MFLLGQAEIWQQIRSAFTWCKFQNVAQSLSQTTTTTLHVTIDCKTSVDLSRAKEIIYVGIKVCKGRML